MNPAVYRQVQREYDLKREKAIRLAEKNKEELLKNNTKYAELVDKKNMLAIELTKVVVRTRGIEQQVAKENLEIKLNQIEKEIEALLKGLPAKDLEPKFECERCEDTGYINGTVRCSCFTQRVINITYNQNNMLKLKDENFNTFDIAYFSNKPDRSKYQSEKSPLENIQEIKKISEAFCNNITDPKQKNLLFIGKAGTGKSFMSSCIAHEVVNKGYTVLYQTAPLLMDMLLEAKIASVRDEMKKEQYANVFDVDLLIIDDLGTETLNNMKFTELFNIINTRLLKDKKTIISTNLSLAELAAEYDERVMSRFIGNYIICMFYGDDIRLKKKRMN